MKQEIQITALVIALVISGTVFAKGSRGGRSHGGGHSAKVATGSGSSVSRSHVHGYPSNKGKFVADHYRSRKDQTKSNNWSAKGNVNPDTGKPGTK